MKFITVVLQIIIILVGIPAKAQVTGRLGESTVTIPLDTYLSLIKPKEVVSLTTIESASLSGEFGQKLQLRIKGTSVGQATPQPVLQNSSQFMISKCSGTASVVNQNQMISVLAKAKDFQVDCDLSVKSWGELVFNFREVLFIASDVKEAESAIENSRVVIHRKLKELTGAAAEVTVTGRYQISVLPESTKFTYYLDIHNPNRTKKTYLLSLANDESVTQIQTTSEYKELDHRKISFNLAPGSNNVRVSGALGASQWKAPVVGALQYLMIQNNPMLQLKIETSAKRISNEDARMPASFSSSRTYLLDSKSTFSWEAKKLEVISSTGYSVGQASYQLYVPEEGPGIVEAQFSLLNRGTPELALKIPGKPVYLEVDGQPQVLAKDVDGNLLTQIPNGDHQILVQYKTEKPFGGWSGAINELMIHPATTLSNVSVNVGFAKSWSALFGKVLTDDFSLFPIGNFVMALFAALLVMIFFKNFQIKKGTQFSLIVIAFLAHILKPGLIYFTCLVLALALFAHHRSQISQHFNSLSKWRKVGLSFAILTGLFFLSSFGINAAEQLTQSTDLQIATSPEMVMPAIASMPQSNYADGSRSRSASSFGHLKGGGGSTAAKGGLFGSFSQGEPVESVADATQAAEVSASDFSSDPDSGEDFKGLPAKLRIPASAHHLYFNQGLIEEKKSPKVKLLIVDQKLLQSIQWLLAFAFVLLVYFERRQMAVYLRLP